MIGFAGDTGEGAGVSAVGADGIPGGRGGAGCSHWQEAGQGKKRGVTAKGGKGAHRIIQ